MRHIGSWPSVLRRKWLQLAVSGLLVLIIGAVMYLSLKDNAMLFLSLLLFLWICVRCSLLYRALAMGRYEVVEGICNELGRVGLGRQRPVRLLQPDGNEYTLRLDRRERFSVGNRYRIYLRQVTGIKRDSAGYPPPTEDLFLASEDLGLYPSSECTETETPC